MPATFGANVETAERFDRVCDGALRDLWIGDVPGEGRGVRDVARDALGRLRLHVHDDDTSALGRHPANDRLADARSSARDQRNLSVEAAGPDARRARRLVKHPSLRFYLVVYRHASASVESTVDRKRVPGDPARVV